jgi:hypothetical protein
MILAFTGSVLMAYVPFESSTPSESIFERCREYISEVAYGGVGPKVWLARNEWDASDAALDARPGRRTPPSSRRPIQPQGCDISPGGHDEVAWQDQLLGALGVMPPAAFERLCQHLLREAGFTRVVVTGKSGDGGVDGQGCCA